MKKFMLALLGLSIPSAVLAQESTGPTVTVHPAVTTAIGNLETAAGNYATAILPYIVSVGLAFIGIAVVYLLFRVFRKFVGGGK